MNRIAIFDLVHGHLVAIGVLVVREAADCIVAGLHADVASEVDLLLARHGPSTCPLFHHGRLDDTHPVVVRVQVLPCVIHVSSVSILAIKALVCGKVRIKRSNVRSAVGSLSAYGLPMSVMKVSAGHGGRVHGCEHRLVGAAATIMRDWSGVVDLMVNGGVVLGVAVMVMHVLGHVHGLLVVSTIARLHLDKRNEFKCDTSKLRDLKNQKEEKWNRKIVKTRQVSCVTILLCKLTG